MGAYDEYLSANLSLDQLNAERWVQLARISELRGGRDIMTYAANLRSRGPISIDYGDILPFCDRLSNLSGSAIDLILETPGGSGEVAEDLVRLLHDKYDDVAVIVPGWAKSAGTIMTMAADDILMGPASALGPIDAQLTWQGKMFSADSLLKGFEDIKAEVNESGTLNKAYIPILQNISPGELKEAVNQLAFAKDLVTEWLAHYKFKDWDAHSDDTPVTVEDRVARAQDIAAALCAHDHWRTHGKSLRIHDLRELKLQITDYSEQPELQDAITRYFTLLQMVFDGTSIYKLWEVPGSWIIRFQKSDQSPAQPLDAPGQGGSEQAKSGLVTLQCPKCQSAIELQLDFVPGVPLLEGRIGYPEGNKLKCHSCGTEIDVADLRNQVELQTGRRVIPRTPDAVEEAVDEV